MAMSGSGSRSPQLSANKDGARTSIGDDVVKFIKGLPQMLKSLLLIEDVAHSCRYCRGAVRYHNQFCSEPCVMKYWKRLRKENAKATGRLSGQISIS